MTKVEMREWVATLEEMIDNKLQKWKKNNVVQDGHDVNLQWQFEQTLMMINILWTDRTEAVVLHCIGPSVCHRYFFDGLTDRTFNKVCDRVGNLSQIIMYPPRDPTDPPPGLHG